MRGHRAIDIPAHGLHAHIHSGKAQVFFRKQSHFLEAEVLAVVVGNLAIGAVVNLKGAGAVVLRDSEFLKARDDCFRNDLHHIGLLEVAGHVVDAAPVGRHGHGSLGLAIGADHVGKVEIHFEARAVFHELDAIAVEDFAAHGRKPDGDLGATADARGIFLPLEYLDLPEPPSDRAHGEQHKKSKKGDA